MHTLLRLLLVMLMAAGTSAPLLAATTSSKGKKSTKSETTATKKKASAKSDSTAAKKTTPTPVGPEPVNEDPPTPVATQAVVSTLSIEDISGFDSYPKQIQSLVQSCLALTHLELGYLYGSSEPSKGGMDCSGTIYHVLHFQGLKDVPRQSDEMCNWVDKKTHLYLTPTATSFGSEEFDNLKPGDLLFWTNSTETTRKLPVTHVMVYLGKLKKSGKRIVFGSSDGRSYMGERRSGVSVFDFSLPRADSTKHFYGYGPTPGLLPVEPERPVLASVTPPPVPVTAPASKETQVVKEAVAVKESPPVKESPAPKVVAAVTKESHAAKETPAAKESRADKTPAASKGDVAPKDTAVAKKPPVVAVKEPASTPKKTPLVEESTAPKEEVRRAIAVTTETPTDSASKKTVVAEAKSDTSAKSSTSSSKPKASTTKKRSTTVSSPTRRRTPAAPQKSVFAQKMDKAVSSVKRFFQQ
jgi:cell wall-associated NlpC family hydrolase